MDENSIIIKSPKQFSILEIPPSKACEYNRLWHSSLPNIHYTNITRNKRWVTYGAFFNDECYAVALWSSPVSRSWNSKPFLELRRFAIKEGSPYNTASYLLSKMIKLIKIKFPDLEKLISYQDIENHIGTIYKASNWILAKKTNVPFWNNGRERNKVVLGGRKIRWEYNIK